MSAAANKKMKISGTREWAVAEINCSRGCPHDCRYCYARYEASRSQQELQVGAKTDWTTCSPLNTGSGIYRKFYDGQVMFPTAHDIVPENLEDCMEGLRQLIDAGNKVLVVSKPHLDCIRTLCSKFSAAKKSLLFRFTITARNQSVLNYWEPYAPDYAERLESLKYAFTAGFETSVSVEPMLDSHDVVAMVHELRPYVTHSIWLGKMNKIALRVPCETEEDRLQIKRIELGQTDKKLIVIYKELYQVQEIRWKESIKKVLGLQVASEPGQDI